MKSFRQGCQFTRASLFGIVFWYADGNQEANYRAVKSTDTICEYTRSSSVQSYAGYALLSYLVHVMGVDKSMSVRIWTDVLKCLTFLATIRSISSNTPVKMMTSTYSNSRNHSIFNRTTRTVAVFAGLLAMGPASAMADSQFSEKAIAVLQSCSEADVSGFATLKERSSPEGVKEVEVYMQMNGLGSDQRAVHIHETASCVPCGSAGGHFDPGNFGMTNPDANHPYHAGDLINIKSKGDTGVMTSISSRVTLSDGPLGLFDADGSAFIVHDNPDSYCPEGEAQGCAGGSRAACGIILPVTTTEDFELHVSKRSLRQTPTELSNTQLSRQAYVFLSPVNPATPVEKVDFFLDGNFVKTEVNAPYDLQGSTDTLAASPLNTTNLSQGKHTAAAIVYLESGEKTFVSSEFTVLNDNESTQDGVCDNPTPISLPFSFDGVANMCWEVSGRLVRTNSWSTESVTINGEEYGNQWANQFPPQIDGKYFISYDGSVAWSHFELVGSN